MKRLREKFNNRIGRILGVIFFIFGIIVLPHILFAVTGVGIAALFVSTTIDQGSGKLGDNVLSRNKAGNYIKKHKKPINQFTVAQQYVREIHQFLTKFWSQDLQPAERDLFNLYATTHPVPNKFGFKVLRSGFQWFMKLNGKSLTDTSTVPFTITPIRTPPLQEIAFTPVSFSLEAGESAIGPPVVPETLVLNCYPADPALWPGKKLKIYASLPTQPGVAKPVTRSLITIDTAAYQTPPGHAVLNIATAYENLYGNLLNPTNDGLVIFLKMYLYNPDTGVKGEVMTTSAYIQPVQ